MLTSFKILHPDILISFNVYNTLFNTVIPDVYKLFIINVLFKKLSPDTFNILFICAFPLIIALFVIFKLFVEILFNILSPDTFKLFSIFVFDKFDNPDTVKLDLNIVLLIVNNVLSVAFPLNIVLLLLTKSSNKIKPFLNIVSPETCNEFTTVILLLKIELLETFILELKLLLPDTYIFELSIALLFKIKSLFIYNDDNILTLFLIYAFP